MDAIWARIRARGRAKSLSASTMAALTGTRESADPGRGSASGQQDREPEPVLERRIVPDLDALVAGWAGAPSAPVPSGSGKGKERETEGEEAPVPTSIPPPLRPGRRHSIDNGALGSVSASVQSSLSSRGQAGDVVDMAQTRPSSSGASKSASTSSSPVSKPRTGMGWSTFGRRTQRTPVLGAGEFGDLAALPPTRPGAGSRAGTTRDNSPARPGTGTASSFTHNSHSQQPDESTSGHGHSASFGHGFEVRTTAPSPASGYTFGSRFGGGRGTPGTPPPVPSLDPALAEGASGSARRPRNSSSLPSISISKGKRFRTAQDIFSAFSRPSSAARRRTEERDVVALGSEVKLSVEARRKREAGSSDTQTGLWPDVPPQVHAHESSASTAASASAADSKDPTTQMPAAEGSSQRKEKSNAKDGSPDTLRSTRSAIPSSEARPSSSRKQSHPPPANPQRIARALQRKPSEPKSRSQSRSQSQSRTPSAAHVQQNPTPSSSLGAAAGQHISRAASRLSQAPSTTLPIPPSTSLPISALVTPRAPSVVSTHHAHSYYHMSDPRKPPRLQPTGWSLHFGDGERQTQTHAVLFFVGFVLFPVWWGAAFVKVPRTRRVGGGKEDAEKAQKGEVVLDDPQLEFDARTWRRRCRIMAVVSLATYVPFVVLLAVFLSKGARQDSR
ncbi:hypothetical protein HMN09_00466400 [Mycena chlorophos]|uniref:Uncharacterized protein n=1 Tax=Mycena chlorophos TaxID=658473 RepID=A0A8H6WG00_MYCCL|nr:hypothetical protein HMN09_00466400 [Mycena chlorophos]